MNIFCLRTRCVWRAKIFQIDHLALLDFRTGYLLHCRTGYLPRRTSEAHRAKQDVFRVVRSRTSPRTDRAKYI
ncbi:hypothetical protein L227DRAFT_579820, partial [Lentinus tigrinus ALCF2SS1-6]